MNSVSIIGNLGQSPELKHTQSGHSLLRLRVAVNDTWRDRNGDKQQRTHWLTCTLWGKRAEGLCPHLSKGDKVGIEGSLEQREWEDRSGQKRSAVEIRVRDVTLLGSPRGGYALPENDGFGDDEIPF